MQFHERVWQETNCLRHYIWQQTPLGRKQEYSPLWTKEEYLPFSSLLDESKEGVCYSSVLKGICIGSFTKAKASVYTCIHNFDGMYTYTFRDCVQILSQLEIFVLAHTYTVGQPMMSLVSYACRAVCKQTTDTKTAISTITSGEGSTACFAI